MTLRLVVSAATVFCAALLAVAPGGAPPALAQDGMDGLRRLGINGAEFAHMMDMFIAGDYAYASVGLGAGFQAYDISDPTAITRVSIGGASAWRSWARGDTAYSFAHIAGFEVYDISTGPGILLGSYNPSDPLAHYEGGFRVGDTLYVAAHQQGLHILNIASLDAISQKGFVSLTDNACWNVTASGGYLYIANGRFGLAVVDLATLSEVAALALPGLANDIVLSGSHAFLSLGADGLASVDLSDPTNPALDDVEPTWGNAFGIGLAGDVLIAGSYPYLERYDVSNPADIVRSGWDATQVYAMGADAGVLSSGDTVIAVSDWRGMAVYAPENDPAGDIDVFPLRLDFGPVADGTPRDTTVLVRNNGAGSLQVTSILVPAGITVTPGVFTVAPGATQAVTVTASTGATLRDKIRYYSDDPDEPTYVQYVYKSNTTFPQIGSLAPDFTLQGTDLASHTLSDYRGRIIFLEFGASW